MRYTIRKGRNYSSPILAKIRGFFGVASWNVSFKIPTNFNVAQEDAISKLWGVSLNGYHHKNSYRIGIRPYSSNLAQLYHYSYQNGERIYKPFGVVLLGKKYKMNVSIKNGMVTIKTIEGNIDPIPEGGSKFPIKVDRIKYGYYLYPYHGGEDKAKETMKFDLKICSIRK